MDILNTKIDTDYVSKILISNFIQKNAANQVKLKNVYKNDYKNENRYCSSFDELIISLNEPDYLLTDTKDLFVTKFKIVIANNLDEDKSKLYDIYNYSKTFNISVIQSGLQEQNMMSSLIYLSDYYNINVYIYNKIINQYYNYIDKNDKNVYIIFDSTGWKISDIDFDVDQIDILSTQLFLKDGFISNNLKNKNAYKSFLQPISKYKMIDLIKIAEDNNILLIDKNGKKKVKQKLYDNINYKYI